MINNFFLTIIYLSFKIYLTRYNPNFPFNLDNLYMTNGILIYIRIYNYIVITYVIT